MTGDAFSRNYVSKDLMKIERTNFASKNGCKIKGSGCDSVEIAVASDTTGPRFESSLRLFLEYLPTVKCIEQAKIIKKRSEFENINICIAI